jgi:hypothetical protein
MVAGTFQRLFRACAGHSADFFTYSSSTAVRAALLAAGFYVAKGRATGPRPETTMLSHEVRTSHLVPAPRIAWWRLAGKMDTFPS